MDLVQKVSQQLVKKSLGDKANGKHIADFSSGDTVGVYVRVREGEKERVQLYKGIVIKLQGKGTTRCFTVRKISSGVGVERTFPFSSPNLDRVELISEGKVRRAKLYFLRKLRGKAATVETELYAGERSEESVAAEKAESKLKHEQDHTTAPKEKAPKKAKPAKPAAKA